MIDKRRLIRLTQQLIRIDSHNPGGSEQSLARFLQGYLHRRGVSSRVIEFQKARSNLLAGIKGSGRHRLLISPHLDTVPAGGNWSVPPLSGLLRGNRIFGRGASDCKGNLAVAIEAICSLVEERVKLDYELIFAATADEESGSNLGLIPLLDKGMLDCDAALILDADEFDIIVTQKGLIHLTVKIRGRKAHGAYPWLGRNAIQDAVEILHALRVEHLTPSMHRRGCEPHRFNRYLHPATVNIGTISGGDKVNMVADSCAVELDIRFLPGESTREILLRLKRLLRRHTRSFTVEIQGIQAPYAIEDSHPLVAHLKGAMRQCGVPPVIAGSEGATVITFFQNKKIPAVATGFGSEGCAHTADEYAEADKLYKGAVVLEAFLKRYAPSLKHVRGVR